MPHSLDPELLHNLPISQALVRAIRELGEYRGKEILYERQAPQVLEALRQVAIIQSTESSNRIEGIEAPPKRIEAIVREKTTPRNRPEQEIAGYRAVLTSIHDHHAGMDFTPGLVLQLHRDLYGFTLQEGGRWKVTDNEITETSADGTRRIRFRTVPAHQTPEAMETLHHRFLEHRERGDVEPLILIAAYVLDFLCIHPFLDGNGRMARLLSLLLLYQAGFSVGRYVSLEKVVEDTRESYYDSLGASSRGWHEGEHSFGPWAEYFLGVMLLTAYRELERRAGELTMARGAKSEMVEAAIGRLPREFRYADIARACPGVSRPTIRRVLDKLRKAGEIECTKPGREATWRKL